ncbi:phosphatase PAP2 family protein [Ideonella paludis]|uniref:Phosphatase PAP2 family protein n=1 Tax=Ideonella paludis TaxID=1233411 RepID=A0ABS5DZ64_9BURK|nr:phosphatase PAP2 family protein [Ideonella paludis]MBQ0936429.1 phosphatase PAP2 family protein [Ideonella paludis]
MSDRSWRWSPFLRVHGLLIPLGLILLANVLRFSGWDDRLTALFFDPVAMTFPARDWPGLERWGHHWAKTAVVCVWVGLLGAAVLAPKLPRLAPHRKLLWLTVAAMGLGPILVTLIKDINTHDCPWNLKMFGGPDDYSAEWFVSRSRAGRCFPGGHAAGGFSVIALAFAAAALGWVGRARGLLLLAIGVGLAFSAVRVVQGAHFVSHNLWSAAIDWAVAAWILAPMMPADLTATLGRAQRTSGPHA